MSVIRLLATGNPAGPQRCGQWVEIGRPVMAGGLIICFFEDVCDGERILQMQVGYITGDNATALFRLPMAEPIHYRHSAQISLMPRATRSHQGRTEAVYLEYVANTRRTA